MDTTLHAHVTTTSRDCDSTYENDYVSRPHEGEDEYEFKSVRIGLDVSAFALQATLTVTPEGYEWSEGTEEGYRHTEVKWCTDNCEDDRRYRDHTAESMGY